MNLLLKLLGLLFVGILSILGFSGFLIWLGLKNPLVQDVLFDGAVSVAKEVLFPDGVTTHQKYQKYQTPKTGKVHDTRDVKLAVRLTNETLGTILKRYPNADLPALIRIMGDPSDSAKYFVGRAGVSENEKWDVYEELDFWRYFEKVSATSFEGFMQVVPKNK